MKYCSHCVSRNNNNCPNLTTGYMKNNIVHYSNKPTLGVKVVTGGYEGGGYKIGGYKVRLSLVTLQKLSVTSAQ